jgi:hypothetical protein
MLPSSRQSDRIILQDTVGVISNTVASNTIVYNVVIPGGSVIPNESVTFEVFWRGLGAGSKTLSATLGGVTVATVTTTSANTFYWLKTLGNRGSSTLLAQNAAIVIPSVSASGSPIINPLNWTVDQPFQIKTTVTVAGQGIEIYMVKLYRS